MYSSTSDEECSNIQNNESDSNTERLMQLATIKNTSTSHTCCLIGLEIILIILYTNSIIVTT